MALRIKDRIEGNIRQSDKVNNSLSIQLNGGAATVYDGSSAKTVNVTPAAIDAATSTHTHGLLTHSLSKVIANTTENSGWSMIVDGYNRSGYMLHSLRTQASAPEWILGNYSSGIAYGGEDTKGVISSAYNSPIIRFAGGNGTTPVWWMGLQGATNTVYNLNTGTNVRAAIADTLTTSRTFSIADNDGTNIGPTVSFNGSTNIIINLPSIIKSNINGTASGNLPHFFLSASSIASHIGLAPQEATSGWYHVNGADTTVLPTSNYGSVIIENDTGTPYQIFFPDNSLYLYKRWSSSGVWNSWQKMSAGYADSAGKLSTARTISLTGAVTGSGSFDGSGNLSIDTSYAVSFEPTRRADNKAGYRLIGTSGTGTWNNKREIWLVASRHTGCGLLSFIWGHNDSDTTAANAYGQIVYIGPKTGGAIFSKDAFQIYYNETNATFYLFWKYTDYNSTRIMKLLTSSGSWTLANGADMDSISTSTYGTLICQTTPAWLEGESITNAVWN